MGQISTGEAVEAWKIAHRFVLDVYRLTNRLPKEEHYGLIPKVRTSSVKVASNIVEGYARKSNEFYLQHLSESQVALEETKYSLLVARDLGYVTDHAYDKVMREAEDLSERLESLRNQLAIGHEAASEEAPKPRKSWFATTRSARETWDDAVAWLQGGRDKVNQRRHERTGPHVWVEEAAPTSYLESER